ncbi:hypothetical protein GW17_00043125 [Ensete ventricosum]|nr:hypothetical protein GW17_00043125 [Ensete ventricosum]
MWHGTELDTPCLTKHTSKPPNTVMAIKRLRTGIEPELGGAAAAALWPPETPPAAPSSSSSSSPPLSSALFADQVATRITALLLPPSLPRFPQPLMRNLCCRSRRRTSRPLDCSSTEGGGGNTVVLSLSLSLSHHAVGVSSNALISFVPQGDRRVMIGSRAPICTYNECRGCRFKCSAEQVPVDAGDPMNSAYRYRCVCHR